MKRLVTIAAVVVAFSVGMTACNREDVGPYQKDEKTFEVSGFDRLVVAGGMDVSIRPGAAFALTAEGDQRNLDDLEVVADRGTLVVRYRNNRNRKFETQIAVTMPTIRGLGLSGGASASVNGFTNLSDIDIEQSGASSSQWKVEVSHLNAELSGASTLSLEGKGTSISTDVSGASNVYAFGFPVRTAVVKASGASRAEVAASDLLDIDASGASKVHYKGDPRMKLNVTGASKVEQVDQD